VAYEYEHGWTGSGSGGIGEERDTTPGPSDGSPAACANLIIRMRTRIPSVSAPITCHLLDSSALVQPSSNFFSTNDAETSTIIPLMFSFYSAKKNLETAVGVN
jgi:hypothetical protein